MYIPTKQIDEGNLKIARFLGITVLENEELIAKGIYDEVDKVPFLRFAQSFDWIFVAICYLQGLGYVVTIDDGSCTIQDENAAEPIVWNNCKKEVTAEELREVLFNSCVEAIDNYYDTNLEELTSTALKNLSEWNKEEEDVE